MIPDFQTLMLPVLKEIEAGSHSFRQISAKLAKEFELTEEERQHLIPSGKQRTFDNRIYWAISYLKQAGLIEYPERGVNKITVTGQQVLDSKIDRIDSKYLLNFPSFLEFKMRKNENVTTKNVAADEIDETKSDNNDATPDEIIRQSFKQLNNALADELLTRIRQSSPDFFENLLIDLLLAMGYGGSAENTSRAIGQSGDGGVDGVIDQDPLGLDQLYIQAKRYGADNVVGSGAIRDFFGALDIKKANKGVFVTTSYFSVAAIKAVKDFSKRIVLIDGQQLAKLLIRYNIGCRDEEVLHLKKVDEDFFEQ